MSEIIHRGLRLRNDQAAGDGIAKLLTEHEARKSAEWRPCSVHPVAETLPSEVVLALPWGPSINSYWQLGFNKKTRQRLLKMSAQGKRFNKAVAIAVRQQYRAAPLTCLVAIYVEAWAPTEGPYGNENWDTDNRLKPIKDALTKGGLWVDDKQSRDDRIVDRGRCAGGKYVVHVRPFTGQREGC